ncbi:hypothetical protein ACFV3R_34410 [Streptomyces sp. NPDC059740]|uniref:allene oxide cyclase barrel-like domain-containing protein n=1 Tax=Streptomyces sp. NPDC059740 TaxID=3346926 RepID=UPI003666D2EC
MVVRGRLTAHPALAAAMAVVLASVLFCALAFSGSSAAGAPAQRRCTVIDDLTEATVNHRYVGESLTIPVQHVGESLVYYDDLYDPRGKVVGHAVGFVSGIYQRPSDGHLMTQYYETVKLPDGTFSDSGIVDRFAMFDGATAHFDVVGTSGKYLGQKGTRDWRFPPPIQHPPKPDTRLQVTIRLCH